MQAALLVGIDAYPSSPLLGCENDADKMAKFLHDERGFPCDQCTILPPESQDRQGILDALSIFANSLAASPGSTGVFFYSGHGFCFDFKTAHPPRIPDVGTYSMICPIDWRGNPARGIISTDFACATSAMLGSKSRLMAVFDCCESGGLIQGSRLVGRVKSPGKAHLSPRKLELAIPVFEPYVGSVSVKACGFDQETMDVPDLPDGSGAGGIFTWALLQVLSNSKNTTSLSSIVSATAALLKANGSNQCPGIRPITAGEVPFPTI